jgi:hypothetical protein
MLVTVKLVPDFSVGCALSVIAYTTVKTHPHPLPSRDESARTDLAGAVSGMCARFSLQRMFKNS